MNFDYTELRKLIINKYDTYSAFAMASGYSRESISMKVNGNRKLTCDDIYTFAELLDIKPFEIGRYFFTLKV